MLHKRIVRMGICDPFILLNCIFNENIFDLLVDELLDAVQRREGQVEQDQVECQCILVKYRNIFICIK